MGEEKTRRRKIGGGEDEKERRRGINERSVIGFLIVSPRNCENHQIGLC